MIKRTIFLAAVAVLTVLVVFQDNGAASTADDTYMDKCSVCHGPDGAGQTAKGKKLKVKDLRSPDVQKLTDAQLSEVISKGKGADMAGYEKELDKATIQQVVAYIRDLAKKK